VIPPEDLEISLYPPVQKGGQHVGTGPHRVRVEHKPTGLVASYLREQSVVASQQDRSPAHDRGGPDPPDVQAMSRNMGVPRNAKELHAAALSCGFYLVRRAGSGHLIYAKEGIDGMVVVSSSPGKWASKRVRADCRRLIERSSK
jgi:predicted RNA binding protein YcfA (HicA-like mRNA interferase family)